MVKRDPLEDIEIHDKADLKYPARTWDDFGNADRLFDRYGAMSRWATDAEVWFIYDGQRWIREGAESHLWLGARETIEDMVNTEAMAYSDAVPEPEVDPETGKRRRGAPRSKSDRELFVAWANQQRTGARMRTMIEVMKANREVTATMDDFDADPFLFNVANGVVDLRTGKFLRHDPDMMLSQMSPVRFDRHAECPMWDAFLARVQPHAPTREYIQRCIGYSLTGSTQEEAMFIHHGSGQNGKSVFIAVMNALFGEYGQTVPRSTLMLKDGAEGVPNDVARMRGKRFLSTVESARGSKLDEERIKELTSGDRTTARHMRAEFFDFKPTGKIHLVTNHLPHIMTGGYGIARRLRDIGWDVRITEEEKDRTLAERIVSEELPGILNWAIRGCRTWQRKGLVAPASVHAKTEKHMEDSDILGQFIKQCLRRRGGAEAVLADIYAEYKGWAEENGVRPMSSVSLSQALIERDFERAEGLHPRRRSAYFTGVRLVLRK